MNLQELKSYLKMDLQDTTQDIFLQLALDSVIEYVITWTNNSFLKGEPPVLTIPAGVKMGIAMMISPMTTGEGVAGAIGESNVKSEKMDGLEVSYFSPKDMSQVAESGGSSSINNRYFAPYRKVRFI